MSIFRSVISLTNVSLSRHVALIQVHGKEYSLKPLPLRTARPFVLEEVVLFEIAEEEGFELEDQMEITKYLRSRVTIVLHSPSGVTIPRTLGVLIADYWVKVNALIERANGLWDERNAEAVKRGEAELPQMLPLIRLKVNIFSALM